MDRWTSIRQKAKEVLADYEQKSGKAAFDTQAGSYAKLKDIVQHCFQLSIIPDFDLPDNVQGCLDRAKGTITHQPGLNRQKLVFLIAHEIGHRALNHPPRDFQCSAADVIEDTNEHLNDEPYAAALVAQDGVFRAYNDRDQWELEANVFAAELLAPTHKICEKINADPNWTVEGLASYFGLTKGAMTNQLAAAVLSRPASEGSTHATPAKQPPAMDEWQQKAAYADAPALIVAGPGAGKTRVLTERFLYLAGQGVEPRRILALTFSNKAADEMRERLCAALPGHEYEIQVFTFHSLGLQLLMQYGKYIGHKPEPKILSPSDAFVLLRSRLDTLPLGSYEDLRFPTQAIGPLLKAISRAKDEMRSPADVLRLADESSTEVENRPAPADEAVAKTLADDRQKATQHTDLAAFYETYQNILREESYVDYGDLISETVRLFDNPQVAEDIRNQWDHILVDEFQDINYASGRFVQALDGGRGRVWAVGDPRQSIYGFRGASRANIKGFTKDYPNAQVINLEINYRSIEDIVQAGQAVPFPTPAGEQSLSVPDLKANRGRPSSDPSIHFGTAPDAKSETTALIALVHNLKQEFAPSQIAILCRKGSLTRRVSDALEKNGIATNWSGKLEDRPPFKDLMGVLLLVADSPQGILRLARQEEHKFSEADSRLLIRTGVQKGNSALAALYAATKGQIEGLSDEGREQAERLKALAFRLRALPSAWCVLATYLFEVARWPREFFTDDSPTNRRYLATTGQLADMAREFSLKGTLSGEAGTAAFVDYVRSCLESGNFECADSTNAMPDAVNVMTIHKSKGLEWSVVIVPGLNEGGDDNRFKVPLLPGLLQEGSERDEMYEGACIFYVAVTRARDRLFLTRPSHSAGKQSSKPLQVLPVFLRNLESTGYLIETTIDALSGNGEQEATASGEPWQFPGQITYSALRTYERCGQQFKYELIETIG